MSCPDTFPKVGFDCELGHIEWIFEDTKEEDVIRINKDVEKKIRIAEGKESTANAFKLQSLEMSYQEMDKRTKDAKMLSNEIREERAKLDEEKKKREEKKRKKKEAQHRDERIIKLFLYSGLIIFAIILVIVLLD